MYPKHTFIVRMLLLCLLLVIGRAAEAQDAPNPELPAGIAVEALTIDLGDFETQAELTYPAEADGPFPTVILIHGAGPADMNFTMVNQWNPGEVISAIFRDIAYALPAQGYAVLRYNKHYVRSAVDIDLQNFYTKANPNLFRADAEIVLDAALENPLVDPESIYLYGWSEGSLAASDLAADRADDVAGVILQGPVAFAPREVFETQVRETGVAYLRSLAPDGQLTAEMLTAAIADADAGLVAKNTLLYVLDFSYFQTGKAAVNPLVDTNADGVIDLEAEFIPAIEGIMDSGFQVGGMFSTFRPEHTPAPILEQVERLLEAAMPVLILQGENDANTPPANAEALATALEAGDGDVTLKLYAGLGHSLGQAETPLVDIFAPIDAQPLADLIEWLDAQQP